MADYGDIGIIQGAYVLSDEIYFVELPDTRIRFTDHSTSLPINTGTSIKSIKYPQYYHLQWLMTSVSEDIVIQCELSPDAYTTGTEVPVIYVKGFQSTNTKAQGSVISGIQDITVSYILPAIYPLPYIVDIYLTYFTEYKTLNYCTWYVNSTNGSFEVLYGSGGTTLSSNCSYPIGEEKPIDYGNITLTDSGVDELTFTIPANTVASATNDAQILLTLSPYGSNVNGTIEDIFTSLGSNWFQLYVYDDTTSLRVDIESWNNDDDFARIWVTIPLLETTAKDIRLEFDSLAASNPDAKHINLIGF